MFKDEQEIKKYILEKSEDDIYFEYLTGQRVWYFEQDEDSPSNKYDEFKRFISRKLDIPFNNISIVGSAKTRFSFAPQKDFKEFDEGSDFDLIIVSNQLYFQIWQAYKEVSLDRYLKNYDKITSNIFNGFISIKDDQETYGKKSLENWQRKILTFKAELQFKFNIQHEVNYRVYSNWRLVQDYHMKSISKLKGEMNEVN